LASASKPLVFAFVDGFAEGVLEELFDLFDVGKNSFARKSYQKLHLSAEIG